MNDSTWHYTQQARSNTISADGMLQCCYLCLTAVSQRLVGWSVRLDIDLDCCYYWKKSKRHHTRYICFWNYKPSCPYGLYLSRWKVGSSSRYICFWNYRPTGPFFVWIVFFTMKDRMMMFYQVGLCKSSQSSRLFYNLSIKAGSYSIREAAMIFFQSYFTSEMSMFTKETSLSPM